MICFLSELTAKFQRETPFSHLQKGHLSFFLFRTKPYIPILIDSKRKEEICQVVSIITTSHQQELFPLRFELPKMSKGTFIYLYLYLYWFFHTFWGFGVLLILL